HTGSGNGVTDERTKDQGETNDQPHPFSVLTEQVFIVDSIHSRLNEIPRVAWVLPGDRNDQHKERLAGLANGLNSFAIGAYARREFRLCWRRQLFRHSRRLDHRTSILVKHTEVDFRLTRRCPGWTLIG